VDIYDERFFIIEAQNVPGFEAIIFGQKVNKK